MLHVRRKYRYIDIRREPEHKDNYQKEKPASALPSLGSHRLCFSTTPLNCRHYITRLILFFRNRYLYRFTSLSKAYLRFIGQSILALRHTNKFTTDVRNTFYCTLCSRKTYKSAKQLHLLHFVH